MEEATWQLSANPTTMLVFLAGGIGEEWPESKDALLKISPLRGSSEECFLSCVCCRTECERRSGLCPAYRKLRLFALACARRVLPLLPDGVCKPAVAAAELYADGMVEAAASVRAAIAFDSVRRSRFPKEATPDDEAWNAVYCAVHRRWQARFDDVAWDRWRLAGGVARDAGRSVGEGEAAIQAALLREVFGNPFQFGSLDAAWRTPTVALLAHAAYEERFLPSGHLDNARLAVLGDALEEVGCNDAVLLEHLRGPGPHVRGCWAVDALLAKE
jgi:hypothetical protein